MGGLAPNRRRRRLAPALCRPLRSILLWAWLPACDPGAREAALLGDGSAAPAGQATTALSPFPSSDRPAPNLPLDEKPRFYAGRALAHQPWVKAPTTTTARDGLGPLYNARACLNCHPNGGKGQAPAAANDALVRGLVRLSIPGTEPRLGAVPEPVYGLQLQTRSTALNHQLRDRPHPTAGDTPVNAVPPEASVHLHWQTRNFDYPDGQQVRLRRPQLRLSHLGYGPLHHDARFSLRVAPPLHGAGLVELIADSDIAALEDPGDRDGDGISGKRNRVWDPRTDRPAPGRFGYKANRASLESAVAGAFADDLGISNRLFPHQPCSAAQLGCARQPHGAHLGQVELPDNLLALVVDYVRNLGVPARRGASLPAVQAGGRLFAQAGCARCHQPRFKTAKSTTHPHLGEQVIWPYCDFLLHDMGPELADQRPDYGASGSEWRTTPLWGAGLAQKISGESSYLHDGRALTLEEAILWHGGEAQHSRDRFVSWPRKKRAQLLSFVASL